MAAGTRLPMWLTSSAQGVFPDAGIAQHSIMATLIVALDLPDAASAIRMADDIGDAVDFYKIGSPLFTAEGPAIIRELRDRGKRVFLDLKYHDIPNTVSGAVHAAARLDVELLTLHASGGASMLRAASAAAAGSGMRLLAVTVLTSFSATELEEVWGKELGSIREEVDRLAALAAATGIDGAVCSALEAESLRRRLGPAFTLLTPGIRPAGGSAGDQVRTATPAAAVRAGADFLVIGRPILEAADPAAAALDVLDQIAGVEAGA
jgi:orotidine-5'-phosphate decarboxylase